MDLRNVSWRGPDIDDYDLLARLPHDLADLLSEINGFIQFDGGLHVRGICAEPLWHSLQHVWSGELALRSLYPGLEPDDIPFAEEAAGDQFILRDRTVYRLRAGTDELESTGTTLGEFLERAQTSPVAFLGLEPLTQLHNEGKVLKPGESISVYPPYLFAESARGVSVRAIPSLELVAFYADLASQTSKLASGTLVEMKVVDSVDRANSGEGAPT